MSTRPPDIKVGKASGGGASVQGGPPINYQGGLARTQQAVDERMKERAEREEKSRLNPRFPYYVIGFDPDFFNVPAAPVVISDDDG